MHATVSESIVSAPVRLSATKVLTLVSLPTVARSGKLATVTTSLLLTLGMLSIGTRTLLGLLSTPSPQAAIAAATAAPPAERARNSRRVKQCSHRIGHVCAARATDATGHSAACLAFPFR